MQNNLAIFDKGIEKMNTMIFNQIIIALQKVAAKLLLHAELARTYHSLTGNTLTSYMVGIYVDDRLFNTMSVMDVDNLKSPTRNKITQGERYVVPWFEDYDTGRIVTVRRENLIKTDEGYGADTSREFLHSFTPSTKGFSLVFTTGTEYSEFLQKVKGFNILTDTFIVTPDIALAELRSTKLN